MTHEEIIEKIKQELIEKLEGNAKGIPFNEEGFKIIVEAVKDTLYVPPDYTITATYDKDAKTLSFSFTQEGMDV